MEILTYLFDIDFKLGLAVYIMIPVFLAGVIEFCYFLDNYLTTYRKQIVNSDVLTKRQLMCRIAYFSEKGARKRQEDSYYISPMTDVSENGIVAVVSDGIGGLKYGDDVSKYVTDRIAESFPLVFEDTEINSTILRGISREIYNKYKLKGGATLAMVHIKDDYMNIYCCGDSNVILIRDGKAIMLNTKQNYLSVLVGKLASNGEVTKSAYLDKDAKALIDFMGNSYSRVNRTFRPIRIFEGDYIIVSSDGLTDAIPMEKLPEYLNKQSVYSAERLKFSVRSSKRPNQDNYTAIIIKMEFDIF
ncbi:MAG: protein phosphatase 2C domain-containing protein [Saccharofermentans sp.]|nr:protein phosphatase 2C domain-containing protein [Saccharofermentans sp.]